MDLLEEAWAKLKEARDAVDAHRRLHPQLHRQYGLYYQVQADLVNAERILRQLGNVLWADQIKLDREILEGYLGRLRPIVDERSALVTEVARLKAAVAAMGAEAE